MIRLPGWRADGSAVVRLYLPVAGPVLAALSAPTHLRQYGDPRRWLDEPFDVIGPIGKQLEF